MTFIERQGVKLPNQPNHTIYQHAVVYLLLTLVTLVESFSLSQCNSNFLCYSPSYLAFSSLICVLRENPKLWYLNSRSCFAGLGATHRRCLRSDSHVKISEDCEARDVFAELLLSFFPFIRGGDQFSGQKLNNPVRLLTSMYVCRHDMQHRIY